MSYEISSGCCQLLLCDQVGNTYTPFIRKFIRQCTQGGPVTITTVDVEVDGVTPYTVQGTVTNCEANILNQFEGLHLEPLCDETTGAVVAYMSIIRTEEPTPATTTLYYSPTGVLLPGGAPANSGPCPDCAGPTVEIVCYALNTAPDDIKQAVMFIECDKSRSYQDLVAGTALVANEITITSCDCLKSISLMCYTTEPECTDPPTNDYGAWQGGAGDQPVTSTQVLCTGETLNITWDNFVAGQIVNSAITNPGELSILVSGGPAATETLTLAWDQPLVGPLAFIIKNVTPGDEDVPNIVPAPTTITPLFTIGNTTTEHQVYYEDVTGINQIDIDLEVITQVSGTFIVYMDPSVELTVVPTETVLVSVTADTCVEPPVLSIYNVETKEEVTDPEIIKTLRVCTDLVENDCDNPLRVEDCVMKWDRDLCDRQDTVIALDLYSFDSNTEEVTRINALTGAVLDSHTPVGVDWTNGTIYDPSGGFYYLYDNIAGEWHRYDATNLASGNTNLGVFGGDPIVGGGFTFGAFDPTTGFGYVGLGGTTRYRIDFNTSTVLDLPAFNGALGAPFTQISSLAITEGGLHYVTSYQGPSLQNAFYIANPLTGVVTHLGTEPGMQLNGSDYDQDTLSGWYGTDANLSILYRWTLPSGSDIAEIGALANPGGTLGIGRATITSIRTPFQRVYHKDLVTNQITHQDHDYDGTPYEVLGTPEPCPVSVEPANVPIISCYVDQNGDHFSAITLVDSDGQIISTLVDGVVTDTSAGTLRLEPCSFCIQESHIVDLGTGQTWTPASLPAGTAVTGITVNILTQAADNSIIDSDGTVITNAPTGLSMSWNSNDNCGFVTPPQSIFAGTGGRIIINMTLRDDT